MQTVPTGSCLNNCFPGGDAVWGCGGSLKRQNLLTGESGILGAMA